MEQVINITSNDQHHEIHSINIYREHVMCHTFVLDTKYTAVNKADKNLHTHRVYNLVGVAETNK